MVDPQGVDDGPVEVVQTEGDQEQDFVIVSDCAKMMNSCRAHKEAGNLHIEPAELGRQSKLSRMKDQLGTKALKMFGFYLIFSSKRMGFFVLNFP